ncbi:hypothetical protein [Glycomyces buryatensis]|uniref:Uncharacterized protein n=1 Tax=Glycomyces buryatensis TaxID=2570927 RepID=A0A4S8PZ81_9ACTN|nr:hypothetical protein [Glycomyces buryatensis]THV37008.1 hypothetical protein FAB82_20850 [Glycomyces buryatensis]
MTLLRLAPVAALLVLSACGQGGGDSAGTPVDAGDNADQSTSSDEPVYEGALTVYQGVERDAAELCGVVAESYPPQCQGLPITGWDWEAVEHEEAEGVRWGSYIVTGTFDGKAFDITEDPVATADVDMADYPELDYSEPEIGEPAEELSVEELQAMVDEIAEAFPRIVYGGWADEQNGVALVDTLLVSPELQTYADEHYPQDTVVFSQMLRPVD